MSLKNRLEKLEKRVLTKEPNWGRIWICDCGSRTGIHAENCETSKHQPGDMTIEVVVPEDQAAGLAVLQAG